MVIPASTTPPSDWRPMAGEKRDESMMASCMSGLASITSFWDIEADFYRCTNPVLHPQAVLARDMRPFSARHEPLQMQGCLSGPFDMCCEHFLSLSHLSTRAFVCDDTDGESFGCLFQGVGPILAWIANNKSCAVPLAVSATNPYQTLGQKPTTRSRPPSFPKCLRS